MESYSSNSLKRDRLC